MSVINQMLKDLDKRQVNQQPSTSNGSGALTTEKSRFSSIAIITLTIVITLFAVYFWQLQNENETLKQQANQLSIANKSLTESNIAIVSIAESEKKASQKVDEKPIVAEKIIENVVDTTTETDSDISVEAEHNPQIIAKKPHDDSDTKVTPIVAEPEKSKPQAKATLSISRRQLSPEILSKQKMKKAERAIANGKYSKAETLFEDVLLLMPTNEEARLQLAALWFGRRAYQPAINVLSQGIAQSPKNTDFRLMQAKIYAKQGRYQVALTILQKYTQTNDIEYLSLLANLSQQLADFDSAIGTYLHLITLQPNTGRWRLGLAMSYDSNSQFSLAKSSYTKAIELGDLSRKSSEFAKQRMTQLGE